MQSDELVMRAKLEASQFNKDLTDLNSKAKTLKTTLKDIENTKGVKSEEYAKTKKELQDTEKAATALVKSLRQMDVATMNTKQLKLEARELAKDMQSADRNTKAYAENAKRLGAVEQELGKAKKQANELKLAGQDLAKPTLWQKISGGVNSVGAAFKAIMVLQIIGYIVEIGKAIFGATAQMEKYDKVLTTAFGGNSKMAKESLAAISKMAKDTVFSIEELTEGYVKMVNRGMRPTQKEMMGMADLAASQGKTFDQLVEAALDAQTGEMERLKEFGIRAKKSGDEVTLSFKGMNQTVKNTPDAIQGAIVAFGTMNGVAGQNKNMMETLNGKTSNLQDTFFQLAAELGESLKPVFIVILGLIQKAIPLVQVLGKVFTSVINVVFGLGEALYNMGRAIVNVLNGNYEGASKAWDDMQKGATKTAKHIANTWSNKEGAVNAEFAGKDQGKKYQAGLTDAQKKGGKERAEAAKKEKEDIDKANAEALKKIAELENDAALEHIRKMNGEVAYNKAVLQQKFQNERTAILKSLESAENKAIQIRLTEAKLDRDLEKLEEENQKITADIVERWTEEEFVKKIKKAQDFANSELANARKHIKDVQLLAQIETKINESLKNDIAAIKADQEADTLKKSEDAAKKQADIAKKKLDAEKFILQQETEATKAMYDWKELNVKANANKLLKVQRERLDAEYKLSIDKLKLEQLAETADAKEKIKDTEELDKVLMGIEAKYNNLELAESKKTADAKIAIEKKVKEEKEKIWNSASSAFTSLLKGDLSAFVSHMDSINKAEQAGWQKRLSENQAKFEAVGQMAQAAVTFLNDLAQAKADKAIAEVQREYEASKAILDQQLAENQVALDAAEAAKTALKESTSAKITAIQESEAAKIQSLEDFYSNLKSVDGAEALAEQTTLANQEAEAKIKAAMLAKDAASSNARQARDEKIIAAEAARDAEINAINMRNDIDAAAKASMIASSQAKSAQEIQMATTEYNEKIRLSQSEMESNIKDATTEKEKKVDLMKQLQTADAEKAKQLIETAKKEAEEKVKIAEKEKNEKLKIVEAEKQKKVQEKKELERVMHDEDKKAKQKEYDLKMKAWKAQQKADIASALIGGALAVVKALAAGFPLGLIMAAVTAVMTGVQIAKIKNQAPPAMPTFATGGMTEGDRHGRSYGSGGIALVNRRTGREQGEMEGGEWIVDRENTAVNLPFLQKMKANKLKGRVVPMGFANGGIVDNIPWGRPMYQYGGRVMKMYEDGGDIPSPASVTSQSVAASAAEGGETANADRDLAKKQANEQLENQKKQLVALQAIGLVLSKIDKNTDKLESATNGVEKAVRDSNQSGKMDSLIGSISKLGKTG